MCKETSPEAGEIKGWLVLIFLHNSGEQYCSGSVVLPWSIFSSEKYHDEK